jgi:hypothetical protein
MASPSSRREVQLVHAEAPGQPLIRAELYRDYPTVELEHFESLWQESRERAATEGMAEGLAPLEHSHWDWRNKIDSVEAGRHLLIAIECQGVVQGIMAILRTPRYSQFTGELVVYVDYLEAAPGNLKGSSNSPRFVGIGTVLIADAIRLGQETGLNGRVGLHSLPQAEGFYETKCQMTRFIQDVNYYNLTYFEFVGHQATAWLVTLEELP